MKNPELEKIRQEAKKVGKAIRENSSNDFLCALRSKFISAVARPEPVRNKEDVIEALMGIMDAAGFQIEFAYYLADRDDWFEGAVVFANALAEK